MTLVELLMALVVLSIGVLSIAALFPVGSKTSIDQSRLTQATDLAQQRMEQLRTKTYSDPDLDPGLHPSSPGEWVGPNNSYLRWWTVTQLTGTLSDVKLVDIRVTWTALKPDTARLVTYFKR
jgi:type II secretory pathway pseudopilin PulG